MTHQPYHQCLRLSLSLVAAGLATPMNAEELLFSLAPSADHLELGSSFALAGDLNADGVTDVAIADRSGFVNSHIGSGIVHLVSGTDGSPIRSYTGVPAVSQNFGFAMVALDADGDAIPDLAVGAPGRSGPSGFGAGAVSIYAGVDGALLATAVGPASSQLGISLANAGDQNGDGSDDLYVGAPNYATSRGLVQLISGLDGSLIRNFETVGSRSSFGSSVAAIGDLDGDGRADLAVCAPGYRVLGNQAGRVQLIRSSDGVVASQIIGSGVFNRLGESLALTADQNGDSLPDLMVGSYSGGTALLVSGADLSMLKDLSVVGLPQYWQLNVGGSLDFDSDGTADFLLGSPGLNPLGVNRVGGIRIVSGLDQSSLFEIAASAPFTGLGLSQVVLEGLGFAVGEKDLVDPASRGSGYARVWKVVQVIDTDGDGVPDDVDLIPDSVMGETVVLLAVDSHVENRVSAEGVTLADRYAKLGTPGDYRNPVHYFVKVLHLSKELLVEKLINKREARQLAAAALKGVKEYKKSNKKAKSKKPGKPGKPAKSPKS